MNFRIVVLLVLGAPLAAVGCSSDPASQCHPADPTCNPVSTGDDGGSSSDGSSSPEDSGTTSHDSGTVTYPDAGGNGPGEGGGPHDSGMSLGNEGGTGGFAEACTSNATCPSAYPICFNYNTKGPHCTKQCATNADCPAQSPGCSGMGVCRIP
jgi:hypothetical protein